MKFLFHRKNKGEKGFTLLELVVVLSAAAFRPDLFCPRSAPAGGRENLYACQANLKQLGWAVQSYARDYEVI